MNNTFRSEMIENDALDENDYQESNNIFDRISRWFCRMCGKNNQLYKLSAHQAWVGTTYGEDECSVPLERRILNKQTAIRNKIRSYFGAIYVSEQKYYTFIEIEENLAAYTDRILQPFVEGGFDVVNVSRLTNILKGTNVYLISWRNAFKGRGNEGGNNTTPKQPVVGDAPVPDKRQINNNNDTE